MNLRCGLVVASLTVVGLLYIQYLIHVNAVKTFKYSQVEYSVSTAMKSQRKCTQCKTVYNELFLVGFFKLIISCLGAEMIPCAVLTVYL